MTNLSIRIHSFIVSAISSFRDDLRDESGQDLLEYALLGGLIAAAIVGVLTLGVMSGALSDMATNIGHCIDFNNSTPCKPGF